MTAPSHAVSTWFEIFPRAAWYAELGSQVPPAVREGGWPGRRRLPFTERHLQCVWFDSALRPTGLLTENGETVAVEDPGVWNLEAGPDFLGAALRIGAGRRRMAGDVEIHLHPSDWESHGHGLDPGYDRVRVHVTYFPGLLPQGLLPAGTLQVSLKDALAANPLFAFENIDLMAYPLAARATPPPCSLALGEWSPDQREALLEAAGQERLRRKAERLAAAARDKGAEQALYEELMCALGYKNNRSPFRRLAELLPVRVLREEAANDHRKAYALLLGVGGLLPRQPDRRWDSGTRALVRSLWNTWWKYQARWEGSTLSRSAWRLAGLRPANHPVRRLMAAAWWFTRGEDLATDWLELAVGHPEDCAERAALGLEAPSETYWDRRLALSAKPQQQAVALVGRTRARAMVNNVFIPFLASQSKTVPAPSNLLGQVCEEGDNGLVRQTAFSLFGRDYPPSLCRSGLRQQGLLQIFHDFCLNDRSRCASCELPEMLSRQRDGGHTLRPNIRDADWRAAIPACRQALPPAP
ncbi:MAG: DUF2851 family protein [Verrucomicrobiota bacterium]